jgi:hypothetical protein
MSKEGIYIQYYIINLFIVNRKILETEGTAMTLKYIDDDTKIHRYDRSLSALRKCTSIKSGGLDFCKWPNP